MRAALETKVLPNGLEVLVYPDPIVPVVTVELVIKNGSSYETPATNGLAHLYEHLFWPDERSNIPSLPNIKNRGISFNASTREESINFYMVSPRADLDITLRFLREAALNPDFGGERLANQSRMVLAEVGRAKANPYDAALRRSTELLFPRNTSYKSPLGSESVVRGASAARLRAMHARFMGPRNAAIVVTGDCDAEDVFRRCAELFGNWAAPASAEPTAGAAAADPGPAPTRASAEVFTSAQVEDVVIRIAWRGPGVATDREMTYAGDVLSEIVRQPASRFQRTLVDSGLLIGIDVTYLTQRSVGMASATFRCAPEKAREAVKRVKAEIAALTSPGYFSDQELQNARAALIRDELLEREDLIGYAHSIGFWWASAGSDYLVGRFDATREIGRPEVERYVERYLNSQIYSAVALVPEPTGFRAAISTSDLLAP